MSRDDLCSILNKIVALLPDAEQQASVKLVGSKGNEEFQLDGLDEIRSAPLASDIGNCHISVYKGDFSVHFFVKFAHVMESSQIAYCSGPVRHLCLDVISLIKIEFSRFKSPFSWMNSTRDIRALYFAAPIGFAPTFYNNMDYSIFIKLGFLGTVCSGLLWLHMIFGSIYTPRPVIRLSSRISDTKTLLPLLSLLVGLVSMIVSVYSVFFKNGS